MMLWHGTLCVCFWTQSYILRKHYLAVYPLSPPLFAIKQVIECYTPKYPLALQSITPFKVNQDGESDQQKQTPIKPVSFVVCLARCHIRISSEGFKNCNWVVMQTIRICFKNAKDEIVFEWNHLIDFLRRSPA